LLTFHKSEPLPQSALHRDEVAAVPTREGAGLEVHATDGRSDANLSPRAEGTSCDSRQLESEPAASLRPKLRNKPKPIMRHRTMLIRRKFHIKL